MNPFEFLRTEIEADSPYPTTVYAALMHVLPYWEREFNERPTAYDNPYAAIRNRVRDLPASPLRDLMESFLSVRIGTWGGPAFVPGDQA